MEVNLEAENTLLGCILNKGDLIKEVLIQEKHFFNVWNRKLFSVLHEIDKKGEHIDVVSVITTMDPHDLKELGGRTYLAQLINSVVDLRHFKTYEKYIINAWQIRSAKQIQEKEIHDLEDISKVIDDYSALTLENEKEDYNHLESIIELREELEREHDGLTGINTGYDHLNKYLDGFQNGDLIISAARPSVGKTAKALNHAIHAAEKDDAVVAFFSLEMASKQLLKRMISTIGRIDGAKLRNPSKSFDVNDWGKLTPAEGILSNMNLYIYDESGQTVRQIKARVAKLKREYPDKKMLVIIDYLQLIRSDRRHENKNIEVGEITRSLKELARDYEVPVYLLSQLSRGLESRQDKRPIMSDLRDSGSIEQDADVIEFLHRDDYYDAQTEKQNVMEVIIAKQRNGPVGTIELRYLKEYNLMVDPIE